MNTLKGLGSDIKLRSIKQVSASLLADDDVPDTLLDWTSEFGVSGFSWLVSFLLSV